MAACLIDASATLAMLFDEGGQRRRLQRLIEPRDLFAPWLWRLEVVNAVLSRERRKHITAAQGTRFLRVLQALGVESIAEPQARSLDALAQLARPHQLSAYDAVYLDAAVAENLPLLTLDENLRLAASRVGVECLKVPAR